MRDHFADIARGTMIAIMALELVYAGQGKTVRK